MKEVERQLDVEKGMRLAYRMWRGAEDRQPVLVLLHGMASNLTRWSEFLERTTLKDTWDILRVDLRGHGRSMVRCKLGMEVWCRDLIRILDAEGYPDAVLGGHSLGAQLAIHFAHLQPSRARGLVLIDPILGEPSRGIVRWGRTLSPLLRWIVWVVRLLNRLGIRRRGIPDRDLRTLDESTREELLSTGRNEEMVGKYGSPWPDLRHFPTASYLEEIVETVRPLPSLAEIHAPVLLVLSRSGTYADPAVTRRMAACFGQAKTVEVDAYHWPLTEKPTETREAIEDWCAALRHVGKSPNGGRQPRDVSRHGP